MEGGVRPRLGAGFAARARGLRRSGALRDEQFASRYPVLYHMAEDGVWGSVKRQKWLSTSDLLDLYQIEGERRFAIESSWRPEIVRIEHDEHGAAFVRDQRPMPEGLLPRCLMGMTPQEW